MGDVYLRPLNEQDALTSCRWRNDPEIWLFTGRKPDRLITPEIEIKWIKSVLKESNSKRFAICISATDEYIGNIQLTNITSEEAELHIFIGEKKYWGKGLGYAALGELIQWTKNNMSIKKIYLYVKKENKPAVHIYLKTGFRFINNEKMIYDL